MPQPYRLSSLLPTLEQTESVLTDMGDTKLPAGLGQMPKEPHFQLFLGSMGEKDTKRMENSKSIRMELTLPSFHSKDGKFKWHKK